MGCGSYSTGDEKRKRKRGREIEKGEKGKAKVMHVTNIYIITNSLHKNIFHFQTYGNDLHP